MKGKVAEMIALVQNISSATVHIFSAQQDGALRRALDGTEATGTMIRAESTDPTPV